MADPNAKWRIDLYSSGSCVYRLDEHGDSVEVVAWAKNSAVARAALEAVRKEYPDYAYEQRRRAHIESE